MSMDPFSFVVVTVAGWMSRHQQEVISYLIEENRVLREQMGNRRLKFNDDQRRRLAAKAKKLGRKMLGQVATIAASETLLTWHRKLIAENYAGCPCRTPVGSQRARKLLLWLSAWLRRIAPGAIDGYREHWPTWVTIWHTTRSGTF